MRTKLKFLYWSIEINLIMWILMLGILFTSQEMELVKPVAIIGFVLSMLLQHWAYYRLYKASGTDEGI